MRKSLSTATARTPLPALRISWYNLALSVKHLNCTLVSLPHKCMFKLISLRSLNLSAEYVSSNIKVTGQPIMLWSWCMRWKILLWMKSLEKFSSDLSYSQRSVQRMAADGNKAVWCKSLFVKIFILILICFAKRLCLLNHFDFDTPSIYWDLICENFLFTCDVI